MRRAIIIIACVMLSACDGRPATITPTPAAAGLAYAQAQATAEAIGVAQATAEAAAAQARLQDQYLRATQQAQVQANATQQAVEARIADVMIEQAQTGATATAIAISATLTSISAQATAQAALLPIEQGNREAAARATATAIARQQANAQTDADINLYVGIVIKIGLAALFLSLLFTLIEWLRKKSAVHLVDGIPIIIEGGAFGGMSIYRLPELPAPVQQPMDYDKDRSHTMVITNGSGPATVTTITPVSDQQARLNAYNRTRVLRLLQRAMNADGSGPNSTRLPGYRVLGMSAPEWVEVTDLIGQWIIKEERKTTVLVPPYGTLMELYNAVQSGRITPTPPAHDSKIVEKHGRTEQSDAPVSAVSALPSV